MSWYGLGVACLTVGLLSSVPPAAAAETGRDLVRSAKSWAYQLQGNVGRLAGSNADMIVVDPDHAGSGTQFRVKSGGGRRAVLAYLSIGEAERGRPYWRSCCSGSSPAWLTSRTQGWAGNYVVRFWQPAWKSIVRGRAADFLARGYDGLYLDRVDSYESVEAPGGSRPAMIAFVREVAAAARAVKPGAAIVVQNAEELLTSAPYLEAIDGVAKEDLFHGADHSGSRNPGGMVSASVSLLDRAKSRGKAIFVVEYLSGGMASHVAGQIRSRGYVPSFAGRSLAN
ncbi:MAG: endo alpha-1,4 polygalactosaminidase [Hyphomicrobiaceae bacterium]